MARGNQSSLFVGLSAVFYFLLLLSPLALLQTASAESSQDPLQESYGTGKQSDPDDFHICGNTFAYLDAVYHPNIASAWIAFKKVEG